MNTNRKIIIALLLSFSLAACMPYHYTATPHIFGKVIDKISGEPISGARVYFKEYQQTAVITDINGNFDIRQFKKWIAVPLAPFDASPPHATLVVEAEGYQTLEIGDLWGKNIQQEKIELTKK